MVEAKIKTITISVSAGGTAEDYWTPNRDVVVSRICITERSGASLENVHIQPLLAGQILADPSFPCAVAGYPYNRGIPFNVRVPKGTELRFKVTNNTTSDVTIDIVLFLE